jgi:hypothetical protein
MKKYFFSIIFIIIFLLMLSGNSFAQNLDGKIGTGYSGGPESFGLDLEVNYHYELDPYFVCGASGGLYWLNWKKELDDEEIENADNLNSKAEETINAYMYPFLATAQVRLVNFEERIGVTPYFGGGLGFSFMAYSYNNGEEDVIDWFSGFTWIINAGASYSPGASSNIEFIGELGYRGAELNEGNRTVNMSGILFHLGVRYNFSSHSGY